MFLAVAPVVVVVGRGAREGTDPGGSDLPLFVPGPEGRSPVLRLTWSVEVWVGPVGPRAPDSGSTSPLDAGYPCVWVTLPSSGDPNL